MFIWFLKVTLPVYSGVQISEWKSVLFQYFALVLVQTVERGARNANVIDFISKENKKLI